MSTQIQPGNAHPFSVGDIVRVVDYSHPGANLTSADIAFLHSRHEFQVESVQQFTIRLTGCARAFAGSRFAMVRAAAHPGMSVTINKHAQPVAPKPFVPAPPVTVPDPKFGIGEVVEYDRSIPAIAQLGTVTDRNWNPLGPSWIYAVELVGGSHAGLSVQLFEMHLRPPCKEIEFPEHKHHHHDGHKHRAGLDKEEIDPVAYKEFMRGL